MVRIKLKQGRQRRVFQRREKEKGRGDWFEREMVTGGEEAAVLRGGCSKGVLMGVVNGRGSRLGIVCWLKEGRSEWVWCLLL